MKRKFTDPDHTVPEFDRSFLPRAQLEFVVIGDTHYILDPEAYAVEFASVRQWPRRIEWALRLVAALDPDFVVHLGDLTEENPRKEGFAAARREALAQLERCGIRPYHVAGNMDIGDKPDATMWSEWVSAGTLASYHEQLGRSWYSFDRGGIHFVVLNSQIMNGPLAEAGEQRRWVRRDLEAHRGEPIFLFMHMPPFFVDPEEPDRGFYNSVDEPARSWITKLLRRHRVQWLFSGHTHFRAFNRAGATRLLVAPSTTTSRAGFYEAFSVAPPEEQGRNDTAKLGFYLVRAGAGGTRVHFVRSGGATRAQKSERGWRRLLTRTSHDLGASPLGLYLRTPLAQQSAGALAWPSVLRQRVRDDHPFLACLEAGVRHVRVPASDLADELQGRRLALLREEGVALTAVWLWSDGRGLIDSLGKFAACVDSMELQVAGTLWPEADCLRALARCGREFGKPAVLAPLLAREPSTAKYHPRTRIGYRPAELEELDRRLAALDLGLDRVVCHVDSEAAPWDAVHSIRARLPLSRIGGFDCVVELPGTDEDLAAGRAAEALFAAAMLPGCRLFLSPFVDLDRTNDPSHGLLDRLSNPRPAFHALRCLNTALFASPEPLRPLAVEQVGSTRVLASRGEKTSHWLVMSPGRSPDLPRLESGDGGSGFSVADLAGGMRRTAKKDELAQILAGVAGPCLISSSRESLKTAG